MCFLDPARPCLAWTMSCMDNVTDIFWTGPLLTTVTTHIDCDPRRTKLRNPTPVPPLHDPLRDSFLDLILQGMCVCRLRLAYQYIAYLKGWPHLLFPFLITESFFLSTV